MPSAGRMWFSKGASVDAGGMGVAVLRHVGAQVAGREVGYGGAGLGRRCGGFLAPLDAVDGLGGAEPGLRRRKLAVGAEGDAPGPALGPALDDVDLPPRGVDADAEAGQLAIPEDPGPRPRPRAGPPPDRSSSACYGAA